MYKVLEVGGHRMFARLFLVLLVIVTVSSAYAEFLFFENFDGELNKAWLVKPGSQHKVKVNRFKGNTTLKLTHDGFIVAKVSTLGYQNVRLTGAIYGLSLEAGDRCSLQVSNDGGTSWTSAAELDEQLDDGITPALAGLYWQGLDDQKQLLIRAAAETDQSADICYFDNIKLIGERSYAFSKNSDGHDLFTSNFLRSTKPLKFPVSNDFYTRPEYGTTASNEFSGRLKYDGMEVFDVSVIEDLFGYQSDIDNLNYNQMPNFDIGLVRDHDDLIPTLRGPQGSSHPHWEIILEPGEVWDQTGDDGWSRAALPFALQQKGANCVHNGLMTFLYKSSGEMSRVAFQVGSETCNYFKFDLWGKLSAKFSSQAIAGKADIVRDYRREVAQRLPLKPIAELSKVYPEINTEKFGSIDEVHPSNMTSFGVVVDGIHYVSECHTRFGPYPYCDIFDLPSYSTAKSITGLAYIRMIKLHPELRGALVSDLVPACNGKQWQGVTIEDALNMTTGNYISPGYEVDEYVSMVPFFDVNTHVGKIQEACHYPRKSEPGSRWVYHTSDTYLFATAIDNFWKQQHGDDADYYRDAMIPLWEQMGLGPLMNLTRRTYDNRQQVYAGYGLTYHRGDIAKLAASILPTKQGIQGQLNLLDKQSLRSALQMDPEDRGVYAAKNTNYKHAFWAWNVQSVLACESPTWVPFMSGFGGITVAMLPNEVVYYYFSDNHNYLWKDAVIEANRIRPICSAD